MKTQTSPDSTRLLSRQSKCSQGRRVVDAIVIPQHDIASFITLQNILSYLLDRINTVITKDNCTTHTQQINTCLLHLKTYLHNDTITSEKERIRILTDLLDEGAKLQISLQLFADNSSPYDLELQAAIIAKSTQIQWLGVCLLEDINNNLPKF